MNLNDIRELTKTNNHIEARIYICENILKDRQLQKQYEAVETLHSFKGYLTPELNTIRQNLDSILRHRLEAKNLLHVWGAL